MGARRALHGKRQRCHHVLAAAGTVAVPRIEMADSVGKGGSYSPFDGWDFMLMSSPGVYGDNVRPRHDALVSWKSPKALWWWKVVLNVRDTFLYGT